MSSAYGAVDLEAALADGLALTFVAALAVLGQFLLHVNLELLIKQKKLFFDSLTIGM